MAGGDIEWFVAWNHVARLRRTDRRRPVGDNPQTAGPQTDHCRSLAFLGALGISVASSFQGLLWKLLVGFGACAGIHAGER